MDPGTTVTSLNQLREQFKSRLKGQLPDEWMDAVFGRAIRTLLYQGRQEPESWREPSDAQSSEFSLEDLVQLEGVTDCISAVNLLKAGLEVRDTDELFVHFRDLKARIIQECLQRFVRTGGGNTAVQQQAPDDEGHLSAGNIDRLVSTEGLNPEPGSIVKVFLSRGELEEICRDVVGRMFTPAFLFEYVCKGPPRVSRDDIRDAQAILRWLGSDDPRARHLASLPSARNAYDPEAPRKSAYSPGVGEDEALLACLTQLNAIIEDETFDPYNVDSNPPSGSPASEFALASDKSRAARIERRECLEAWLGGALGPRRGFSPMRASLGSYLLSSAFSRIEDARREALGMYSANRRSDAADYSPGTLTHENIPDAAGLLRQILQPANAAQARWAVRLQEQETPPARHARLLTLPTLGPSPIAKAFLEDLSSLIASTPVFTGEDAANGELPPGLRGLAAAWHSLNTSHTRKQKPPAPSRKSQAAFNQLALRICFPWLVRPSIALTPIPPLDDVPSDDPNPGGGETRNTPPETGALDRSPWATLLMKPDFAAILDLFLAVRIPPDTFPEATLKALQFGLNPSRCTRDPAHLPEFLNCLRLEYAYLNKVLEHLVQELEHVRILVAEDLHSLSDAVGQTAVLPPECLVELGDCLESRWEYAPEQCHLDEETWNGALRARRHASDAGVEGGPSFVPRFRKAVQRVRSGGPALHGDLALVLEGLIRRITEAENSRAFTEDPLKAATKSLGLGQESHRVLWGIVSAAHRLFLSWRRQVRLQEDLKKFTDNDGQWVRSQAEISIWLACDQATISRRFADPLPAEAKDKAALFDVHVFQRTGTHYGTTLEPR